VALVVAEEAESLASPVKQVAQALQVKGMRAVQVLMERLPQFVRVEAVVVLVQLVLLPLIAHLMLAPAVRV
jgi:hypothetical protein